MIGYLFVKFRVNQDQGQQIGLNIIVELYWGKGYLLIHSLPIVRSYRNAFPIPLHGRIDIFGHILFRHFFISYYFLMKKIEFVILIIRLLFYVHFLPL